MKKVKPIPEGYHTVTPCLTLKDSLKAIDFYKKAFGAIEWCTLPSPDGNGTMHAAIQIGDSIIMMGDERPDQQCKSAETLGDSPVSLFIYVKNVDSAFNQAVNAGAKIAMPLDDMFWGDRCASLKDPFGYLWVIATHTRELTDEQIQEGAQSFFAQMAKS
jgi:uncharacterized glyoxalase superfamily protein PhnB